MFSYSKMAACCLFKNRNRRVFRGFWAEAVLPALAIQAHMGKTVAKDVAPGPSDG